MSPKRYAAAAALLVAAVSVAAVLPSGKITITKSCGSALDTEVCTWVKSDGDRAVEIGATIPMSLVESVPADPEMVWPPQSLAIVDLPSEARESVGIDHLGINWEAHGHPPAIFMEPHFDFHFYSVSQEAIAAIDCADLSKPATAPEGYTLPDIEIPDMGTLVGLCVPLMGMHALPKADLEAEGGWDASMIVGFYRGAPIFFEPMITKARLLERTDFTLPVPAVDGLPEGTRYPTEVHADYDADSDSYRLVASGFETR